MPDPYLLASHCLSCLSTSRFYARSILIYASSYHFKPYSLYFHIQSLAQPNSQRSWWWATTESTTWLSLHWCLKAPLVSCQAPTNWPVWRWRWGICKCLVKILWQHRMEDDGSRDLKAFEVNDMWVWGEPSSQDYLGRDEGLGVSRHGVISM